MKKMQINNPNGSIVYWKSDVFVLSRDTLFFLHGLTADHTMFEQQFLFFENDYNIIAWDAPAHGESRPYVSFTYGEAANAIKHTKISSEEISDGRKYSLLFLCDKVEVSC